MKKSYLVVMLVMTVVVFGAIAWFATPAEKKLTPIDTSTDTTAGPPDIFLFEPAPNTVAQRGILVSGKARSSDNTVTVRLKNPTTNTYYEYSASPKIEAKEPGLYGSFNQGINIQSLQTQFGNATSVVVEVSVVNQQQKQVITEVPILLASSKPSLKVFFSPSDAVQTDCSIVTAVERIIETPGDLGTLAIQELLKGPTAAEKANGLFTSIPVSAKLNKVTIINGIARADFSVLDQGIAGSCMVGAIRAQITETLMALPDVKRVMISVDGREDEEVLQP